MNYFFFVNGINTDNEDINAWNARAERWIDRNTNDKAGSYRYHVRTWERWLHQKKHVDNVAIALRDCAPIDARLILVGHSNGCAILCQLLRQYPGLKVERLHLIGAAEDGDYNANGLNHAIESGQVKRVVWHCSETDSVLELAKATRFKLLRAIGLGYDYGGLTGPLKMDVIDEHETGIPSPFDRTSVKWFTGYDHGTYFEPGEKFEETMALIENWQDLPAFTDLQKYDFRADEGTA